MKSAWSWVRVLPAAQLPVKVVSSTGMCTVSFRCTSKPPQDCTTTNSVGGVELAGSHPGARTAYAVLSEAGTVGCCPEAEPGGMAFGNPTACLNAWYTTSARADDGG